MLIFILLVACVLTNVPRYDICHNPPGNPDNYRTLWNIPYPAAVAHKREHPNDCFRPCIIPGGCGEPPVPIFTWNTFCEGIVSVELDASRSFDLDGQIVIYEWDFGDGSTQTFTESWMGHVYTTTGVYSITLRVVDDQNLSTTVTIEVNPCVCGNNMTETGETCDPPGEGCNYMCQTLPGYQCTGEPSVCQQCGICPEGLTDCGCGNCVDLITNGSHCGRCNNYCSILGECENSYCKSGAICVEDESEPQWKFCENCPGNPSNIEYDAKHCSGCQETCANYGYKNTTCQTSTCQNCPLGRRDCNVDGQDGCETIIEIDPNNCGRCGLKCPVYEPTCDNGGYPGEPGQCKCQYHSKSALSSGKLDCDCDNVFDILHYSDDNCGYCGNNCLARNMVCKYDPTNPISVNDYRCNCLNANSPEQCWYPLTLCGCRCISRETFKTDPKNCGICENKCPAHKPFCVNGECVCDLPPLNCPENYADCTCGVAGFGLPGCYNDLRWDRNNCGQCGRKCGSSQVCQNKECVSIF